MTFGHAQPQQRGEWYVVEWESEHTDIIRALRDSGITVWPSERLEEALKSITTSPIANMTNWPNPKRDV